MSLPSPRYRSDIDGLRGIAVLLVVVFHAFRGMAPGGFVGVDVFFVISGFLITGIILDDQQRRCFSFRQFYARRVRRIFPALIIVLTATYATNWYLLTPDAFTSLGRNLFGGAAFVSNFVLWSEVGYFDFEANFKPLLHLWSLGVEEQFYIFWPLALWLAFGLRSRSAGTPIAWGILLTSFALNIMLSSSAPSGAFYLPITRIWEILCGAVLAMGVSSGSRIAETVTNFFRSLPISLATARRWAIGVEARGISGFVLIIWAALSFNRSVTFPGWRALVPVTGAVLLISAEGSWINRQLARPLIVYVGLISYPLYLWHWPVLAFVRDEFLPETGKFPGWAAVTAVGVAVALASLTYHFVETPIRSRPPRPRYVAALGAAIVALAGLGAVTVLEHGFYGRIPESIRGAFITAANPDFGWRPGCMLNPEQGAADFNDTCIDRGPEPLVLLWGDSAAAALYPGLHTLQNKGGFRLAVLARSSCAPIPDRDAPLNPHCRMGNDYALGIIARENPAVVVLHSMWRTGYDSASIERSVTAIRRATAARIVLVGPPPFWPGGLPTAYFQYYKQTSSLIPKYSRFHLEDEDVIENSLRTAAARLQIDYFSLHDVLCQSEGCLTRISADAKDVTAVDWAHLSAAGSTYVTARLLPLVVSSPETATH